jgi:hypothetical protein
MAAKDVIYFPFGAQLSTRLWLPSRVPPEPVAKSPPQTGPIHVRALSSLLVWTIGVCAKIESLESSVVVEGVYGTRGVPTMKSDLRTELGLLNRNVDEMIGFLQCATDAGVWTQQEATWHTARLESLRAKLNADSENSRLRVNVPMGCG